VNNPTKDGQGEPKEEKQKEKEAQDLMVPKRRRQGEDLSLLVDQPCKEGASAEGQGPRAADWGFLLLQQEALGEKRRTHEGTLATRFGTATITSKARGEQEGR